MSVVVEKLTLTEFEARYNRGDQQYEFWHGEAIAKAVPTWIHGRLQIIIGWLLLEVGYQAGSEVELRVVSDARLKPDVIATNNQIEQAYPTQAADVAVEISSPDDSASYLLEKCQAYASWGFEHVYVVDPETRKVFRWKDVSLVQVNALTTIPVERIWLELDKSPQRLK